MSGGDRHYVKLLDGQCCPPAMLPPATVQAASAWLAVQQSGQSDWCYQQLRKHLCSVAAAGGNTALRLQTRQALQKLQFSILTGNMALAARQNQQVGQALGVG
jgi:hypothetical protein